MNRELEEDIKTLKVRENLQIKLTDKALTDLKLLAYEAGLGSAGELISSFIGDLTGWHSNGSDERMYAEQWFERTYGHIDYEYPFLYHLFNEDYSRPGDFEELLEDPSVLDDVYETYEAEAGGRTIIDIDECKKILKDLIEKEVIL